MSKRTTIWLIIGASLVLIGGAIFVGVMTALKWDFTKLSTAEYEIRENYKNISIITDTADIMFVAAENGEGSVVCHEQKNMKHLVTVNDGTLVIEVVDTRKWYEHIGINFGTPKITVYIPQGEYGALSVKSSTGEVKFDGSDAAEISVKTDTGDVTGTLLTDKVFIVETDTGRVDVPQTVAGGRCEITTDTGDVRIKIQQ